MNIKIKNLFIIFSLIFQILYSGCARKIAENSEDKKIMAQLTIEEVQSKYQDQIMEIPGVVGVGIGAVDSVKVIKVLVVKKNKDLEKKIPKKLDSYSVIVEETGEIKAY
jgi:hypothetical protein